MSDAAALRRTIAGLLEPGEQPSLASRVLNWFLFGLIVANLVAMVLESLPELGAAQRATFERFERVSLWIFAVEYGLRLWSATALPRFRGEVRGRIRFALTPLAIIDLLAILPLLPFLGADLRAARTLRLFRVFRVAKLARYSRSLRLFGRVFREHSSELVMVFLFLAALLLLASSAMYYVESAAGSAGFESIPATFWWAVATLTTVGYGDVYPVTALGKLLASIICILGIGMVALPTGILGAGFMKEISRGSFHACPHCGGELENH